MDAVRQRQRERFLFLKYLYERTRGSETAPVAEQEIGEALGLDEEDLRLVSIYLRREDLIRGLGRAAVVLTHQGIIEIEAALSKPNQPTEHFPVNIISIGTASQFQIQQGTTGSTQAGSFSSERMQRLSLLIQEVKTKSPELHLKGDDATVAQEDISAIETQLSSPRPRPGVIRECLLSLRSIAENAAGSAVGAGIVQAISAFLTGG